MDHKVSKDMISSGMIPSGEKTQADLGKTQYGSAPSPSSLMDAYKSIYEHHQKDKDGNTIPHEGEELNENLAGIAAKGLQMASRGARQVGKMAAQGSVKARQMQAQGGVKKAIGDKLQSAKKKTALTSGQKEALLGRTTAGKITRGVGALAAANDVLQNSGHSLASSFAGAFNNDSDGPEDIFAFQVTSQDGSNVLISHYADQPYGGRGGDIVVDTYRTLFDSTSDVRLFFFYYSGFNGGILTRKYTNEYGNVPTIRVAEMHLIRAEANFRLGSSTGLAPLTEINALRGRSGAPALSSLSLDLIFNERQLELGFEGHILHDKKRFGKSIAGLPANSPRLVCPIPQSEMDSNSLMTQNPGY